MESNMIVSWAVIIVTTISFIVFIQIRSKKKLKKTVSVLQNFAKEFNSSLSNYDHWDKTLIGIVNTRDSKLFFIRTIGINESRVAINISEVKNCRMVKTERTASYNGENVGVIDKIELVFSFIDTHKPDIALEFYNSEYDHLTLSGELQFAQKWSEMVKSILTTNKALANEFNKAKSPATPSIKQPVFNNRGISNSNQGKIKRAAHESQSA